MPDFRGLIDTDHGSVILLDYFGRSRAYRPGNRQMVSAAILASDDARYRWLNDVICVGTVEIRNDMLVLDTAERICEPVADL
ncbi:MAG: hypothetical protein NVSMB22_14350 [Chloroflexota bacterium]